MYLVLPNRGWFLILILFHHVLWWYYLRRSYLANPSLGNKLVWSTFIILLVLKIVMEWLLLTYNFFLEWMSGIIACGYIFKNFGRSELTGDFKGYFKITTTMSICWEYLSIVRMCIQSWGILCGLEVHCVSVWVNSMLEWNCVGGCRQVCVNC